MKNLEVGFVRDDGTEVMLQFKKEPWGFELPCRSEKDEKKFEAWFLDFYDKTGLSIVSIFEETLPKNSPKTFVEMFSNFL